MKTIFIKIKEGKNWISNSLDVPFHVIFWNGIAIIGFICLYLKWWFGTPSDDFEMMFFMTQLFSSLFCLALVIDGKTEAHFWPLFLITTWILIALVFLFLGAGWCIIKLNELLDS